jgi:enoyl-CoA hydratase/carnithine racemase
MEYPDYQFLKFDRKPNGVLLIAINRPEKMNAATTRMHTEYAGLSISAAETLILSSMHAPHFCSAR